MKRYEVVKALASQRIYFRADKGRPSATPTVGTATSGGNVLTAAADTYVTQSTVNTTIAASVAAGAKSLTVTSATGIIVGDRYRITSEYGRADDIQVDGINGTTIYLESPLQKAFDLVDGATYGTFESLDFYYTLQTADVANLEEMAVATATYATGGLTYKARQLFDVVLVPLPNALTSDVVYARLGADLANQDPKRGEDFKDQREAAWGVLKRRIYQHAGECGQWRPSMVVDPTDLEEWAISIFTRVCHEQGVAVIRTELQPTHEELMNIESAEAERTLKSISWLDLDESGTESEGEHMPMTLDFTR